MRSKLAALAGALILALAVTGCRGLGSGAGSGNPGSVKLKLLGNFAMPTYVTQPPGENDLLFVVQKTGEVRVVKDGQQLRSPFLALTDHVKSDTEEQGMLSMAFAPDYQSSGLFYISYTDLAGDLVIYEYRRDANDPLHANKASERLVATFGSDPAPIHYSGYLVFGPDKHLYIGVGDGGPSHDPHRVAEDLHLPLGKILRIDPRPESGRPFTVPDSNPFVKNHKGLPEIFAYGLRNPWRFSFDGGKVFIGDVQQDKVEEIDIRKTSDFDGANFGWSAYEADRVENPDQKPLAKGSIHPALTYKHHPACSVTGGYVVHGSPSSLADRYLYGDFCTGELRSFRPDGTKAVDDHALGLSVPALASFGKDNDGHIYAVSLNGPVYELAPG